MSNKFCVSNKSSCVIMLFKTSLSLLILLLDPSLLCPIVAIERPGVSLFVGYLVCSDLSSLWLCKIFLFLEFCISAIDVHNYRFFSMYPAWYILSLLCLLIHIIYQLWKGVHIYLNYLIRCVKTLPCSLYC